MIFHRYRPLLFAAFLAGLGLSSGCGGGGPRVPSNGPDLGAPRVPWRDKTHEEKQAFMGAHVEPTMRRVFQKFDGSGYAGFGCETCHGGDMEAVGFHMPNSLFALPKKDPIAAATEYDEKTAKFMMHDVLPTFAKLLSEKPGEGVTCFTCHPAED